MLKRIASSFSLILALCSVAAATNYSALEKALRAASTVQAKDQVLKSFIEENSDLSTNDAALYSKIYEYQNSPTQKQADSLESAIASRARLEGSSAPTGNVTANVQSIKGSIVYKSDRGPEANSNWISKALEHLRNLIPNPSNRLPRGSLPGFGGLGFLGQAFIALLVIALIALIVYFIAQFNFRKNLARKASALLEDDEPQRTADEWLELADGLTSQGRYREAVRCLYLACLLRFDEAGISRFDRSQTNWEHLARFRGSPKRPPDIEFTTETRAFDLIWYGKQVRGIEDVEQFKAWYRDVMAAIRGARAA